MLRLWQVLVYHDLLGMMQHPHHAKVTPKFCKQYAAVGAIIQEGLQQYRAEVSAREKFYLLALEPYLGLPGPLHMYQSPHQFLLVACRS